MIATVRARVRSSFALVLTVAVAGCGGSGSGSDPLPEQLEVHAHGRVVAGGIGGSTLEVYRVGDYGAPVATVTTSTGSAVGEIGKFSFSIPDAPRDAMFLLVATGGTAFDIDEDGVLDGFPIPNQGKVHALATAAQLDGAEVFLSAVTDVVYHRARYFLQALYDEAYLSRTCDSWASFVLRSSVAGAPAVDNEDALAYDPLLSAEATFRPHQGYVDYVRWVVLGTASPSDAVGLSKQEISYQVAQWQSFGIDLVGDRAYVCFGSVGLGIWDVSDPSWMEYVGLHDSPGRALAVQVVGNLAYLADAEAGLRIVDVSNPAAPALVGSLDVGGTVVDLQVVGSVAYLANDDDAGPMLHVVDVSAPGTPALLGEVAVNRTPKRVRANGGYVYIGEGELLEAFDVGDPTDPVSLGAISTDYPSHMDLAAGHAFVAGDDRLRVYSLDSPDAPQPIALVQLPGHETHGVRLRGTRLFVARDLGITVVDVSDPANPLVLGLLPTTGSAIDVAGEGSLIVATQQAGGFATLAAGTPPPSGIVGSVPVPGYAGALDASADRLYVTAMNPDTLFVVDTSDPLAPAIRGHIAAGASAPEGLATNGGVAFVANVDGLGSFDVSSASGPFVLDGDAELSGLQRLATGPGVVYAAGGSALAAYDVSTPSALDHLVTLPVVGQVCELARDGNALFLAAGSEGIFTYDVSTPATMTQKGHVATSGQACSVDAAPGFAVVTLMSQPWNEGTLVVLGTSDLSAPTTIAYTYLPGPSYQVVESDGVAYVGGSAWGVHVVDVSGPSDGIDYTATIPVPGNVTDLDVEGGYVYVSVGDPAGAVHVLRAARAVVP